MEINVGIVAYTIVFTNEAIGRASAGGDICITVGGAEGTGVGGSGWPGGCVG